MKTLISYKKMSFIAESLNIIILLDMKCFKITLKRILFLNMKGQTQLCSPQMSMFDMMKADLLMTGLVSECSQSLHWGMVSSMQSAVCTA